MKEAIIVAVSLSIGLSLGLIGAGGSILTIPAFVYILKIDPLSSGIYSMFVVGICSLVGGIRSLFNDLVDLQVAALFGLPSIIGVLIARRVIFPSIPSRLFSLGNFVVSKDIAFMLFISALMFSAALKMLRASRKGSDKTIQIKERKSGLLMLQGLLVGLVTGLLGIGGGFLIVPALYLWASLPMRNAIGTTLLIISINSLFGFLTSYSAAIIDWNLLTQFSAGSILGVLIGNKIAERISGNYLKKAFGWFVLTISCLIVVKQFFL
jgi:uncharacterized membrane protein YfcA